MIHLIHLLCGLHCTHLLSRLSGRLLAPDVLGEVGIIIFMLSASWSSKIYLRFTTLCFHILLAKKLSFFFFFPSLFVSGTQLPVYNLYLGNANMQNEYHPLHTMSVSAGPVTYLGLGTHCFNKELWLLKMLLLWSGWIPMSPVHPCLLLVAPQASSLVATWGGNTPPVQSALQQEQHNGSN